MGDGTGWLRNEEERSDGGRNDKYRKESEEPPPSRHLTITRYILEEARDDRSRDIRKRTAHTVEGEGFAKLMWFEDGNNKSEAGGDETGSGDT